MLSQPFLLFASLLLAVQTGLLAAVLVPLISARSGVLPSATVADRPVYRCDDALVRRRQAERAWMEVPFISGDSRTVLVFQEVDRTRLITVQNLLATAQADVKRFCGD